jgi:hypothetical protein
MTAPVPPPSLKHEQSRPNPTEKPLVHLLSLPCLAMRAINAYLGVYHLPWEWGLRSTADLVSWLLDEVPHGEAGAEWRNERERLMPTLADVKRAETVLAWARARDGRSDYE